MKTRMRLEFDSISENEAFARVAVAAFLARINPTLEELADIKTAVSEAVTNAIIHGYQGEIHTVLLETAVEERSIEVVITDHGVGMEDVKKAMEPMFTTRPDLDRAGMGFLFMEAFMDEVQVFSKPGEGTRVQMKKCLASGSGKRDS